MLRYFIMIIYTFLLASLWCNDDLFLHAQSAVLIEVNSGSVLYSKNADVPIPPASLTKIMTLYLAYQALQSGQWQLDSPVSISARASWDQQPPRSSLMMLEQGQHATLYDLMLGLAIPSGNDAAVALAENLAGSVENFVTQMNEKAQELGLTHVHFTDPSGVEATNSITAHDYALLARQYLSEFPMSLQELHTVPQFVYPKPQNWAENGKKWSFTFPNHINLISTYEGTDGLKTGYIDESGYNLVATAQRGSMRLIAVALGIQAAGRQTGSLRREADVKTLFDYGFDHFENFDVKQWFNLQNITLKAWGGHDKILPVQVKMPSYVLIKKGVDPLINVPKLAVMAPCQVGTQVATLNIKINDWSQQPQTLRMPVYAQNSITRLPWLLWLNDGVYYFISRFKSHFMA
jgi:D-alanyl-D-alanine carboxypeptidase